MKIRFDIEALQKQSRDKIREMRQRIIFFVKRYKAAWIVLIAVSLLSAVPEFAINIFQKEPVKAKIENYISQFPVAISYDGITLGAYRGVELYNLRISAETDFSKERVALKAPVFRLKFDIKELLLNRKLILKEIVIEDGILELDSQNAQNYKELAEQILETLAVENSPVIVLDDSSVIYNDNREGRNNKLEFRNVQGRIQAKDNLLQFFASYQDDNWGKGTVRYISSNCESCEAGHGDYTLEFAKLPLAGFNSFFPGFAFDRGFTDGNLSISFIPEEASVFKGEGTFFIKSASLKKQDEEFLQVEEAKVQTTFRQGEKEWSLSVEGDWDESKLNMSFLKKKESLWPSVFTFELEPASPEAKVYLPYGFVLQGLNRVLLDIRESEKSKGKYEIVQGEAEVEAGELYDLNYTSFQIQLKDLSVEVNENQIFAKSVIMRGGSEVSAEIEGTLEPFEKRITTYYYPYGGFKQKAANVTILALNMKAEGEITAKTLDWKDLRDYYDTFYQKWTQAVKTGFSQGWRASIVRERKWFNQFFVSTDVYFNLNIENGLFGENNGIPLSGEAFVRNSVFQLELEDPERENRIFVRWNAMQNYPFLTGEFKFRFPADCIFADLWIPSNVIQNFENAQYSYNFTSTGERPVDLVKSHRGEGSFTFLNASLNPEIKNSLSTKDKVPLKWDELKGYMKRSGERGWLYDIRGASMTYSAWSRGSWNYAPEESSWQFFPEVHEVKPLEN